MKKVVAHPRWGEVTITRTRKARRITLSVVPPGKVRLTIPALCSFKSALAFLGEKEEWIERTIAKLAVKYPEQPILPPYRTTKRELVMNPAATDSVSSRVTATKITVTFPHSLTPESEEVQQVAKDAIWRALRSEAKEVLPPMVERLAQEHGFRYRSVTVRATVSRWGSCSGRDDISLSAYLILLPPHLVEYIILHELCHTKHKDHSEMFHTLLDKCLGGREKEYIREIRSYRPGAL